MATFDKIIAECGVASYSFAMWNALLPAEWDSILRDAAANRRMQSCLKNIRDAVRDRDRKLVEEYRAVAQERALVVYDWFVAPQTNANRRNRLAMIPADIRGMIRSYLRVDITDGRKTITCLMGVRHSFDDAPAIAYVGSIRKYSWYHRGKLHRIGDPVKVHVMAEYDRISCWWYLNGVAASRENIKQIIINANGQCLGSTTLSIWPLALSANSRDYVNLRAELWAKYSNYTA